MTPAWPYLDSGGYLARDGAHLRAEGRQIVDYLEDRFRLLAIYEQLSASSRGQLAHLGARGDGAWRRVLARVQRMRECGSWPTWPAFAAMSDRAIRMEY